VTTSDRLLAQGQRLFAARSTAPLALLPCVALALPDAWRIQAASTAGVQRGWIVAGLCVGALGLLVRASGVAFAPDGASSRDTHQLRASSLTTSGIYATVRNPLYLGNALMWLGPVVSLRVWWLVALTALAYWLYIERVILAEEVFLERTFGTAFRDYAARTPAFLPRWRQWRRPEGAFDWRRLANEHNGLLAMVSSMAVFQAGVGMAAGGRSAAEWRTERADLLALVAGSVVLSAVIVAIKRTARRPPQDTLTGRR